MVGGVGVWSWCWSRVDWGGVDSDWRRVYGNWAGAWAVCGGGPGLGNIDWGSIGGWSIGGNSGFAWGGVDSSWGSIWLRSWVSVSVGTIGWWLVVRSVWVGGWGSISWSWSWEVVVSLLGASPGGVGSGSAVDVAGSGAGAVASVGNLSAAGVVVWGLGYWGSRAGSIVCWVIGAGVGTVWLWLWLSGGAGVGAIWLGLGVWISRAVVSWLGSGSSTGAWGGVDWLWGSRRHSVVFAGESRAGNGGGSDESGEMHFEY